MLIKFRGGLISSKTLALWQATARLLYFVCVLRRGDCSREIRLTPVVYYLFLLLCRTLVSTAASQAVHAKTTSSCLRFQLCRRIMPCKTTGMVFLSLLDKIEMMDRVVKSCFFVLFSFVFCFFLQRHYAHGFNHLPSQSHSVNINKFEMTVFVMWCFL